MRGPVRGDPDQTVAEVNFGEIFYLPGRIHEAACILLPEHLDEALMIVASSCVE
ncbi:hypothetical protein GGQ64_004831 [Rhizobium azooxidifex]|uniref:Uncharacterized protein n=1 Tax=Mycoplana azooxidifex TaxID=1636188 RepID=A0A7W6DFC9_9HYPH|nr:hypothetical protein [Mycoplana azooxidifex]